MGATEWTVVVLVVGARLFLPFTIPKFPLVGSIACMILDSIDQSIFQQFPAIPLEGYQSYDKSLDIYYLAIIYMSTMRNWTNAVRVQDELVPVLLPPRRGGRVRAHAGARHPLHLPQHVRVLLRLRRGGAPALGLGAHGQVDGDRLHRPHLGVHQAAAGVVDPHRPARHDRLHQGDAVRREHRRELGEAIANRPWVLVLAIVVCRRAHRRSATGSSPARRRPAIAGPASRPIRCRPSAGAPSCTGPSRRPRRSSTARCSRRWS